MITLIIWRQLVSLSLMAILSLTFKSDWGVFEKLYIKYVSDVAVCAGQVRGLRDAFVC